MNPVAFSIFGIDVMWYGILIALGVAAGIYFGVQLAKNSKVIDPETFLDFPLYAILLGVLCGRLYYVIFSWDYYQHHLNEIMAIRNGGMAIHGGIIGGIIAGIIFSKVKKIPFFELADLVAPGLPLGQAIGRWGNYINGEAHGGPTNLPWAINVGGQMVHPTFLYESIWNIGIFLFIYLYLRKKRSYRGQLFLTYSVLYSIGRFFIEGLRTDSLYIGPLRQAQVISIAIIVVSIVLMAILRKNKSENLTL